MNSDILQRVELLEKRVTDLETRERQRVESFAGLQTKLTEAVKKEGPLGLVKALMKGALVNG